MARKMLFYTGTVLLDPSRNEPVDYKYRRNVFTFMSNVGYLLSQGKYLSDDKWEYCLNTVEENTLSGGDRIFKYFKPSTSFGRAGELVEYDPEHVDLYLGESSALNSQVTLTIKTSAIRQNTTSLHGFGWSKKIDISDNFNVDNSSGKCSENDLIKLEEWLAYAGDEPVFAVCDCNCFHNSAYLFGRLALRRRYEESKRVLSEISPRLPVINLVREDQQVVCLYKPEPAVLIINFDTHNDDLSSRGQANSDGWGKALLSNFDYGAYVVIGVGAGNEAQLHIRTKANEEYDTPNEMRSLITLSVIKSEDDLENEFIVLWDALEKKINTPFFYYYVTIDRDCMLNSHTQWGHEKSVFKDASHVRSVLNTMAKTLKSRNVNLTGMDITGLPEVTKLPTTNYELVPIVKSRVYDNQGVPCGDSPRKRRAQYSDLVPGQPPRPTGRPTSYDLKYREKEEQYIEDLRKWNISEIGIKYNREKEEYDRKKEVYTEVMTNPPICQGDCLKCQKIIMGRLKNEIINIYDDFKNKWL